jgi:thiol:disulfide interchange protein
MRSAILGLAIVAAIAIGGYYGFNAIQTQRGKSALAATQLVFRPLPEALALAKSQHRPVLVDFSAIWCPTCRLLHRTVFTDAAVKAAITQGYVLARVDYDAAEAPAFMQQYGVTGFPSLLVLDADGRLLRRLPVQFEPAAFVAELTPPKS